MSIREDIEKVENKIVEVEKKSLAMELLDDLKKANKRMFITLMVVIGLWFVTGLYLVYVLNDIGTIEETTITQDNENGYNNYIGNDGDINNGETND